MQRAGSIGSAPLWRPVTAYALGIACSANVDIILAVVFTGLTFLISVLLRKVLIYNEMAKSLFLTALFWMAGIGAALLYERTMPSPLPEDEAIYKCRVAESPYFKGKTWRCTVDILERMDSIHTDRGVCALLYMADTVEYSSLKAGDYIYLNAFFSLPHYNDGYKKYLLHNSICGTAYIAPWNIRHIGYMDTGGVMSFADKCRDKVKRWYASIGFTGDELAVLSALTLGVKNDISDDLKEDYSVSGASHVLALSGLHVGLIFLVLNVLLRPLSSMPFGRYISWGLMTLLLLVFAVFTGLSPSVVRACFMMSAFGFTGMIMRGGTSLNTLFLIALCLLVYNPMYIYNVSFLMSFVAVLFILLFQPLIASKIYVKNRIVKYIIDLFVISVIAQIGITPIVASYFGNFSVYGVLSSILIVPLLTVLMYVIIIMLVLFWWPVAVSFLAGLVSKGLALMNGIATFFSSLPAASLSGLEPDFVDIALFYSLAVSVIYYVNKFTPYRLRIMLVTVVAVIAWADYRLYNNIKRKEIVLTSSFSGVTCVYHSSFDKYCFNRMLSDTAFVRNGDMWQYGNYANFGGKSFLLAESPLYGFPVSDKLCEVDYLWLSRGVKGDLQEIEKTYGFKNIILDTSLTPYYYNYYKNYADSMRIPVIDMKYTEMFKINLK